MIGSVFGPSFNQKLGLILTFNIGSVFFSLFVIINILPAYRQSKLSEDPDNDNWFI